MLLYACQIAAMPAARRGAIVPGLIVGIVPIGEAIGHYEIKNIGGREAAMRIRIARALCKYKRMLRFALIVSGADHERLRRC